MSEKTPDAQLPIAVASPRRASLVLPWIRAHLKGLVLFGLAAAAVVGGFIIFPRDEPTTPASNVTGVTFFSPVSLTSIKVDLTKGKQNATLVVITVLDKNAAARSSDSTIKATFQVSSKTWGTGTNHCSPSPCTNPDSVFKYESITVWLPKSAKSATAIIPIPSDGSLGYGIRSNPEYATAVVPEVKYYLEPPKTPATAPAIPARVTYAMRDSNQYDWSGSGNYPSADAKSVAWQRAAGAGYFVASGTNLKRQSWDNDELFLAGALLGASGAFLAAAIAEII